MIRFLQKWLILFILPLGIGCATAGNSRPVAWVDGVPLTEGDLIEALTMTHMSGVAQPDKHIDVGEYLNELIDNRLMVQEAYRMGLENDPWVQASLQEYRLRESVSRLYKEAIAGKVDLSDDEIARFYRERMEELHMRQITVQKEEEAQAVRKEIEAGADMASLAGRYSLDPFKDKGGDRGYVRRGEIRAAKGEIVPDFKEGELCTIKTPDGFYCLMRVEGVKPCPEKDPAEIRRISGKGLRKKKEEELSRSILIGCAKEIDVFTDRALLAKISISGTQGEKAGDSVEEDTPLARVGEETLTIREFRRELNENVRNQPDTVDLNTVKENLVESWIDRKLVDYLALKQNYEREPAFRDKLRRHEEILVRKLFDKKVTLPQIQSSEDALRAYYDGHKDRYQKPIGYKLKGISYEEEAKALAALEELRGGADFSWMSKREAGGVSVEGSDWVKENELSPSLKKILSVLKPGEISEVFPDRGRRRIVKLEAKSEIEYEPFDQVKSIVAKHYMKDSYDSLCRNYAAELRKDSTISINESLVRELTEKFFPHELR